MEEFIKTFFTLCFYEIPERVNRHLCHISKHLTAMDHSVTNIVDVGLRSDVKNLVNNILNKE